MTDVHGEIGILARLDTVQEIPVFSVPICVEMDFVRPDGLFEDLRIAGFEIGPPGRALNPTLGSLAADAGSAVVQNHLHPVGIGILDVVFLGGVV